MYAKNNNQRGFAGWAVKLVSLAVAASMTGCSLMHTPYETPAVQTPEQWQYRVQAPSMLQSNDRWWQLFNDEQLNALVELAFERNNDLAAAALKVRQAQLQAKLAGSDLLPTVTGRLNASGERGIDISEAWSKGSGTSLSVSYEADLWGSLSSLKNAADWEAMATEADREATALSLAGTVADLYWQLIYLNQRIASTQQSIAYTQKTLELVLAQHAAGAVSILEPTQARQSLLTQQSNLSQLVQQRVETRNALAIIFDMPPTEEGLKAILPDEPAFLGYEELPPVQEGVPADVLARRPDLRAAEMRLRESLANVDATRASYYPQLTLTGALGTSSSSLGNLLNNPVATLGAGLLLPFLQFNEMRFNNELAKARYEEAVVNFRQTLYQALVDVENTLSARAQLNIQYALLQQSLTDARKTESIYEERYRAGEVPLKDWLDAQESRRSAEISLAANQLSRLQNQVMLYQALGGGV
ncbi:Toxin and drug export protein A [Saezia sanguinis]|uniref:Toxin and drug export protein A n=1 Tax=Saezia sanguinis TaxID=1965230 RepID=A0A433SDB9_9BURK|nr:TolC family protein [Saezia sanguinis]RUS66733.1 Toxin and drug export protein A [Saezia sanguinis]